MGKYSIALTEDERHKLDKIRDRHPKPYMRERAVAILKVAEGYSPHYVAMNCLLKPRDPDAVYGWINNYLASGVDGLKRKKYCRPSFSPQEMKALEDMLHRPPCLYDQWGNRWTLAKIKVASAYVLPRLSDYTLSGIWRLLGRLGMRYKRGRLHITSPDARYNEKKAWIEDAKQEARATPQEVVTLLGDEKTYRRVPTVSCCAYADKGTKQPTSVSTPGSNTQRRISGVMNIVDGSVWHIQRSVLGVKALTAMLALVADWVRSSHPQVRKINLIWDCWPVHFHPDVLLAAHRVGITLIPLPTYAPWENPIEKLWRWLCQEVLHMHDCSGNWHALWDRVDDFLNQFENGSQELLQYVGLLPKN